MAKNIKRLLAILLVLCFCMAQMVAPAFAANNNQNSSKYEWYQVYVNGALVKADQGPAGNDGWLVRGVYSWNVSISGTTMSWKAGAHSGTVNLKNFITIPDGYEVAENGYTVEHKSVEGVNSQADRFDNAIITVTIKALYNEQTGETIPVTEPVETEPPATEPPAPVDYAPYVSVAKSADKAVYEIGETITWTITVTNTSEYTAYNVTVSDPLTGDSWYVQELTSGNSSTFTATTVAAEEGALKNAAVVSWTDNDEIPDGDEPNEPKNSSDEETVEVEKPEPIDYAPYVSVSKSSDKAVYEIGETITWTITVTNTSEYTAYDVVITDALTGDSWYVQELTSGNSSTFSATSDAVREGFMKNVAVVSWTDNDEIPDGDEPNEPKTSSDDETVEVERPEPIDYAPYVSVVKVADKDLYEIGETITWTITVINTSEYTAHDVVVSDPLTGDSWNLSSLAPGASQVFTATSVAAEEGYLKNVAVVSWTDKDEVPDRIETDEPKNSSDEETVKVEKPEPINYTPYVTVSKTADKEVYEIGETITWTITVTNTSEYTAYDVAVSDPLTGDSWNLSSLAPGASQTFTATSVAAEPGALKNVVAISWTDNDEIPDGDEPDEPKKTNDEEIVEVNEPAPTEPEPTEPPVLTNHSPLIQVTKTAEQDVYEVGQTIIWTIAVTNVSEHTAYDVVVSDPLTGDSWNIAELAPGASCVYTATSAAEEAGQLRNVVVVSWTDNDEIPDGDEPEEIKEITDEEIVTVEEPEPINYTPAVEVTKVADKEVYKVGEVITWTITVSNTGDCSAFNVSVADEMTGDEWLIPELAPGAVRVFTVTAVAKEAGQLRNVIVTSWTDNDEIPDDKEPDEPKKTDDEEIVTVEEPVDYEPVVKISKVADKRTYRPGETISWYILVRNISEHNAYNVVITDEITGDVWTIPELAPGAWKGFVATSKAGNGATEYNKVVASWEDNDEIPDENEPDEIVSAEDEETVNIVTPTPIPDPVDPDPTDPVNPDPTDPVNPDPTDPADPGFDDPADPVNPDPVSGEIEIPDEDVPLADVPKTGDVSILWAAASVLSAGGMVVVNRKRKEE